MTLDPRTVRVASAGEGYAPESVERALTQLFHDAGFDRANPLGALIQPGDRVLIKPNWVLHANQGAGGLECLVTHTQVIAAVLGWVERARPGQVTIGDAPVQGCDFKALRKAAGLESLRAGRVEDFRLVERTGGFAGAPRLTERGPGDFVLFDLGKSSALEPVAKPDGRFRVTMYDPSQLGRAHGPGRHHYLVAREAVEADVVVNLPKLKTHKKTGLTGALKNLVGINGHKSYLPHHRKGSPGEGGDCYESASMWKRAAEDMFDRANRDGNGLGRWWSRLGAASLSLDRLEGGDGDVEGSWPGNDTLWRTVLDLAAIVECGRQDGTLSAQPQRRVLTITDAIVAGQGEGPLAPDPLPLGVLTLATSLAAADWVHALLLGFDPRKIPLIREAFSRPEVAGGAAPDGILIRWDGARLDEEEIVSKAGAAARPPAGWRGQCEWRAAGRELVSC